MSIGVKGLVVKDYTGKSIVHKTLGSRDPESSGRFEQMRQVKAKNNGLLSNSGATMAYMSTISFLMIVDFFIK